MSKENQNAKLTGNSPVKVRTTATNVKSKSPPVETCGDELDERPISDTVRRMAREAREADDRGETEPFPL